MPLVSPNNGINIPFTSSADDLVKESQRVVAELEKVKRAVKQQGKELERQAKVEEQAFQKTRISITDFRSAYQIAMDVVRVGQQVWNATGQAVVNYGDQVQKLKTITGQTAEETSRQIQMADDLRVSYDTLARSLQFASKKGVDTSIEGLVKLGEEYKKLPKGIEQTQFLMDKFGKSGIEMNKILSQTSDTIRDLAANTPDGLIIKDKDLQAIAQYNKSLDTLQDTWTSLKMSAGKEVLPFVSRVLGELNKNIEESGAGLGLLRFGFDDLYRAITGTGGRLDDTTNAMQDNASAAEDDASSTDNLVESQQKAEEQAKALSRVYQGLLSSMFEINNENEKYADTIAGIEKKDADLAAQKNQLTLKMWEEQKAGKLTNDEYLRYIQQLNEITQSQNENATAREKAAEDLAKASKQRVYDLAKERLGADGVIDSGEFEYLQRIAVQKGLVSQAASDQAIAESKAADEIVNSFQRTQGPMDQALSTMQQIAAYNGMTVQFGVNFSTTGSVSNPGSVYNYGGITSYSGSGMGVMHSRDSGGSGMAGTPYKIGVPEVYVPDRSGEFIPLGGANKKNFGATYIVNVYNPKKETAENSIRQELKKLSYIGVAS